MVFWFLVWLQINIMWRCEYSFMRVLYNMEHLYIFIKWNILKCMDKVDILKCMDAQKTFLHCEMLPLFLSFVLPVHTCDMKSSPMHQQSVLCTPVDQCFWGPKFETRIRFGEDQYIVKIHIWDLCSMCSFLRCLIHNQNES